ncbi:MAG: ATP-binding protein [Planctomycetota bacterium]|jgi:Pyruvate/2-oxoacid:ferredoxin oxidoreductase delta subunit
MAVRNIVNINEEKCNGCGQCVTACAEGAIEIIDGKAKLISEIYCDGLGACLGECPEDAITIEQREAAEFDEEATNAHLARTQKGPAQSNFVCPGTMTAKLRDSAETTEADGVKVPSQLDQWPVQLKLISPNAAYFANSDLLLVADCVPFAMGDFHSCFLGGHSIAIGCPKLDDGDFYIDKFAQILKANKLKSLKVIHMEVPCCSGLTFIARQALAASGANISFEDITIDLRGNVIKTEVCGAEND